jgi:hypothetical protein
VSDTGRFARSGGIVARRVAGELILVPVDARSSDVVAKAADLYALNDTGAELWDALDEPRSAPELARILMSDFDIAHAQATKDVEAFLTDMLQIGAIVRAGDRQ